MQAPLSLAALLLAGCLSVPTRAQSPAPTPPQRATQLFPAPKEPLTIRAGSEGAPVLKMLEDFGRITGENLVIDKQTRAVLQQAETGLLRDLEVPPERVWEIAEQILVESDFVLVPLSRTEPRMMAVKSLNTSNRANLRNTALFVPPAELGLYARHPAILVTTVVDLPNTDVRNLSNSMRTMFTDANTQQIIPVGSSNSLIVTGFGGSVASIVQTLELVERAAAAIVPAARDARAQETSERREASPIEPKPAEAEPAEAPR